MNKYILISIAFLTISMVINAKKVKFAVDMTGQTVSSNGVHVMGDFQKAAGFANGDWQSNTTLMVNEAGTNIYSVVVDISAFNKYEYRFLNGDQSYNTEFIPTESRVGYDFDDNRWIWVDSLSNDTTKIGAILYAGNAPQGLNLLRFKINMPNLSSIASTGVHVAGDFQEWDPAKTRMYSFDGTTYEYIAYVNTGSYQYKYYNGNASDKSETVPTGCATNSSRTINVAGDTVLEAVCFAQCSSTCVTTGISENDLSGVIKLYPNPALDYVLIEFNDQKNLHNVMLLDVNGQVIRSFNNYTDDNLRLNRENLPAGIYFVMIDNSNKRTMRTLVFE